MAHGFTDDKTVWEETGKSDTVHSPDRPGSNEEWNNIWFASRGDVVLNYTARGWRDSCGPDTPGRVDGALPPACTSHEYWIHLDDKRWDPVYARLLKRAASYPEVERIFVNPAIKKKLCETVAGDRAWMNKVRPFWGHDEHFHVRIGCQPGSPGCKPQQSTGRGDGCDKSLAWWFTDEPWRPAKGPAKPRARDIMTMASLPQACRAVLDAPSPPSAQAAIFNGGSSMPVAAAAPAEAAPVPDAGAPFDANAFAETPKIGVPLPRPRPGS